jgi:hypothetical protein
VFLFFGNMDAKHSNDLLPALHTTPGGPDQPNSNNNNPGSSLASSAHGRITGHYITPGGPGDDEQDTTRTVGVFIGRNIDPKTMPDHDRYTSTTEELQGNIQNAMAASLSLSDRLQTRITDRKEELGKLREIREKLASVNKQKVELNKERDEIQQQIIRLDEQRRKEREQLDDMRRGFKFENPNDYDDSIASFQERLKADDLPPAHEQEYRNQIRRLKSQKAAAQSWMDRRAKSEEKQYDTTELRKTRGEKSSEIRALGDHEDQVRITYRNQLEKVIALDDEINMIFASRRDQNIALDTLKREQGVLDREYEMARLQYYRQYRQEEYLKRIDERNARRQRWEEQQILQDADRKGREQAAAKARGDGANASDRPRETATMHPYALEMHYCNELIIYLKRVAPGAEELLQNAQSSAQHGTAMDGKHNDNDSDIDEKSSSTNEFNMFAAPTDQTDSQSKKNAASFASRTMHAAVKITHIPDIFQQFEKIGLAPPLDVGSVPEVIKDLRQKLEYYKSAPAPLSLMQKRMLKKQSAKEKQEREVLKDSLAQKAQERERALAATRALMEQERERRNIVRDGITPGGPDGQ